MSKASKIASAIAGTGLLIGAGATAVVVGIAIAIGLFAAITAFQALIVWGVWNLTASLFDFIPETYRDIGFMQIWGAVALLRIIGRILFGTIKVKKGDE